MFRPRKIITACVDSPKFDYLNIAIVSLSAIVLIGACYIIFPKLYYRYDFESQLILLIAIFLIVCILPNLIFSWIQNKSTLYEPENYFILILFAFLTSLLFGMVSYGLQGTFPYTYVIDTNLVNEEYYSFKRQNSQDLQVANQNVEAIEKMHVTALKNVNTPVHLIDSGRTWIFGDEKYTYEFGDIDIEFSESRNRYNIASYSMELSSDGNDVSIIPLHRIISVYPLPKENAAQTIISYLAERKKWEIDVALKQIINNEKRIDKKDFNPSLDVYIYDSAMHVLGNNTGYFKAYSVQGRIVELLKTLFKFFYISYFVSFLVKRFSVKE